jgi:thymidylate kinase
MPDNLPKLLQLLRTSEDYVVLRNHDISASLARGGDIDVLPANQVKFRAALYADLGLPLWRIHRSYVQQEFYAWGHMDLANEMGWRGATYLETSDVLNSGTRNTFGIKTPRLAHEAIVSWFASLLWGGFFKSRYREVIVSAARTDGTEFKRVLAFAAGPALGPRLFDMATGGRPEDSEQWVSTLRCTVWWRAFGRRPVATTLGFLNFFWRELRLNLAPPTPWIAVLGPDGCGKSTVISLVQARLGQIGLKTTVFHWRPQFLRPGDPKAGPVTDPHGKAPRGFLASLAKLLFLFLDWQCGCRFRMARLRAKAQIVIFDRHFLDLLIDPRRYRYGGPAWLAEFTARLIPKPTLLFLLDAPTAVLQARKQEVPVEETERQRAAYRETVEGLPFGRIIDATQSPEQVAEAVVAELFSFTTARELRRQSSSRKR